jgi:hypothetical protein
MVINYLLKMVIFKLRMVVNTFAKDAVFWRETLTAPGGHAVTCRFQYKKPENRSRLSGF